jgi:hydroxyacylglutathione hydrolase
MDNYAYILTDTKTGINAVVDASEAAPIIKNCSELNYIFSTHHHFDHVDGNLGLKEAFNAKVIGGDDRIPGLDIELKDGDTFMLGESKIEAIDVSGHTQKHLIYYSKEAKALFTGDTLFNLCIGGLFEGTPEQMFNSLKKIKALPDDTMFYPGHEYTFHAAQNALELSNNSQAVIEYLEKAKSRLQQGLPVHPVSLGVEKQTNPYLIPNSLKEFEELF